MGVPVYRGVAVDGVARADEALGINAELVVRWLVRFLRDEVSRRRSVERVVVGLSGGIDSAVTSYLCAQAFGPENTHVIRLPYKLSSQASLDHAELVASSLGTPMRTIDITAMADGYCDPHEPDISDARRGNVCARARASILFDQSAKLGGLPIGTGNKTERLFGYYTWHADDSPPINPLGDLYKAQVRAIARQLGVPEAIISKPPTADLVLGQTDESDLGISYDEADRILVLLAQGYRREMLTDLGFDAVKVDLVIRKVDSTHWKRQLPTVAMVSTTAIGEFYLRPVDY